MTIFKKLNLKLFSIFIVSISTGCSSALKEKNILDLDIVWERSGVNFNGVKSNLEDQMLIHVRGRIYFHPLSGSNTDEAKLYPCKTKISIVDNLSLIHI